MWVNELAGGLTYFTLFSKPVPCTMHINIRELEAQAHVLRC